MGEYVTLDKMFYSLIFKHVVVVVVAAVTVVVVVVEAPVTSTFFLIAIIVEAFIRNYTAFIIKYDNNMH
jgi:hypothetical protein